MAKERTGRPPGRPPGRKNKAPRKDKGIRRPPVAVRRHLEICPITGLPEPEELHKVKKLTKVITRIRHLAGRGMSPRFISVMTGVPVADVSPGGVYFEDMEIGIGEAVLAAAENHYARVLAGKSTHEVMFYLKSIGGWAETADGRKKSRGEVGEPEEVTGMDIAFDDEEEEVIGTKTGDSEGHED